MENLKLLDYLLEHHKVVCTILIVYGYVLSMITDWGMEFICRKIKSEVPID